MAAAATSRACNGKITTNFYMEPKMRCKMDTPYNRSISFLFRVASLTTLMLLAGCGAGTSNLPQGQILSQMESQTQKQNLNAAIISGQNYRASYRDYKVGPEDLLEIRIFGQDNLNREVRVNGQGEVSLPLVGGLKVAGLSPMDIEKRAVQAYGSQFLRDPQVTVSVKEYRHQKVAVTGAVDKPGYYEMIGPRTLLEMLAMAGGLQDKAGAKAGDVVQVIRQQTPPQSAQGEITVIDLRKLLAGGAIELNISIQHGDVIHVPFASNAYVLGGVKKPGSVSVKDNLTMTQAIAMAGGVDPVLATDRVNILRFDDKKNAVSVTASLGRVLSRQEPDIPLKENDVVVVTESSIKKALFTFKQLLPIGMAAPIIP